IQTSTRPSCLSLQNLEELDLTSSTDLANIGFNIRKNTLPRIRVLFSSSTRVLIQNSVQVFNRDLAVLGHLLDLVTGNPIMVSQLRHNRDLVLLHLRQVSPCDFVLRQNVIQQVPGVFTFYPIGSRNISHTLDLVLKFLTNLNIPSGQSRPGNSSTLSHRQRRIRNTTVHVFHDRFGVIPKTFNLGLGSINTHKTLETKHPYQSSSGSSCSTDW